MLRRYYVYVLYRDLERMRPFYVGKGCADRYKRHSYDAFYTWMKCTNKHKNRIIRQCVEQFGKVPHDFYATGLTEDEALATERALIVLWGRETQPGGVLTNTTDGGEGISGYRHTQETLETIRTKNTGQKRTPEQIAKLTVAQAKRNAEIAAGTRVIIYKWSEETLAKRAAALEARGGRRRGHGKVDVDVTGMTPAEARHARMSAAAKARTDGRGRGVPRSEETKRKLSEANKGRKHSEETRAKFRERKVSDETRAKMTVSQKARWAQRKQETSVGLP